MTTQGPTVLLRRLATAEVDFVVVGGVAVVVQALPRFTRDLDVCYATDQPNLERIAGVLSEIGARLRGIDEDLPFVPDARMLRQTQMLTLTTTDGELDLLIDPDGAPPYAKLRARADAIDLDGLTVRVASISDLLSMKRAAGRQQDLIDVEALEIARRRGGRRPKA